MSSYLEILSENAATTAKIEKLKAYGEQNGRGDTFATSVDRKHAREAAQTCDCLLQSARGANQFEYNKVAEKRIESLDEDIRVQHDLIQLFERENLRYIMNPTGEAQRFRKDLAQEIAMQDLERKPNFQRAYAKYFEMDDRAIASEQISQNLQHIGEARLHIGKLTEQKKFFEDVKLEAGKSLNTGYQPTTAADIHRILEEARSNKPSNAQATRKISLR